MPEAGLADHVIAEMSCVDKGMRKGSPAASSQYGPFQAELHTRGSHQLAEATGQEKESGARIRFFVPSPRYFLNGENDPF